MALSGVQRLAVLVALSLVLGCGSGPSPETSAPPVGDGETDPGPPPPGLKVYGSGTWVSRPTTGGLLLQGGGADHVQALAWLTARSGGGDAVVLRTSDSAGYNDFLVRTVGGLNSVRTLVVDQRVHAEAPWVEAVLRRAELVFIAGGDQSEYDRLWRGTRMISTLLEQIRTRQLPVGGTSAGMAVLGGLAYIPQGSAVDASEALGDPYHSRMASVLPTFLPHPLSVGLLTDTHGSERNRLGRTCAFLARCLTDGLAPLGALRGLMADEGTAVAIEPSGLARVYGRSTREDHAFFFRVTATPTRCRPGEPLAWRDGLSVLRIRGFEDGRHTFDTLTWGAGPLGWTPLEVIDGRVTPDLQTPD